MPKQTKTDKTAIKKKAMIKAMVKHDANVTDACKEVGMCRQTYYDWLEDEDFKKGIDQAFEERTDKVEKAAMKLIDDMNPTMTIFYLKTQGKNRGWQENTNLTGGLKLDHGFKLFNR